MHRNSLLALSLVVLVAPIATRAQGFGTAAAIGDREIFLSEPNNPYHPGTVYVYRSQGSDWREVAQLRANDGSPLDRFGRSMAYDGGRLLIGATSIDDSRGAAFIFERDASGAWHQAAKLVATGFEDGAAGRKVALRGDNAYVASWGRNDGRGEIRVWTRNASGAWTETQTLVASDGRPNDFFGFAISLDNDLLLTAAGLRDTSKGVGYVFHRGADGHWAQEGQLAVDGLSRGAGLGTGLLVIGDVAMLGAPGVDAGSGAVYLFHRESAGTWTAAGRLPLPDNAARFQFGASIERVGDEVWVGAPGAENGQGVIYRYTKVADAWTLNGKETIQGLRPSDGFGGMVTATGDHVVVGLTNADYGMGMSVILTRAGNRWNASSKLFPKTENMAAMTGKKTECTEGKVGTFGCSGVDLLAYLPISAIGGGRGVALNDIWGWTDPQTSREYALVGRIDGTSFVDVTDPVNPRYVGDLPKTEGSQANAWRDIKVYKDHAFIVADGAREHGMQVFDLTRLRNARGTTPVTFTEDAHYDKIASAHNIVIDTASGYAFAVGTNGGGETCGGALHMIDIRDPNAPKFAGCFADPATGIQKTGYTHDAECTVYHGPDQAYQGRQICFNSSETALGIADVTDKTNPKAISNASYPNVAYTHQGWLTDDQKYFFMDDEGDETAGTVAGTRTLVWDVSDLDDPVLVKEYISDNPAIDHNLYIKGNLMYQSNYTSGLRILDVTDPVNPRPVGFFDTMPLGPDTPTFAGTWSNYPFFKSGTIVVSSIGEGLFILKKSDRPLVP